MGHRQLRTLGLALDPAYLIAHAVQHRLPQIRADGAVAARLEAVPPLKRPDEGVLYKVVRVAQIAGPPWEPSGGPPLEARQISRQQVVQRAVVARAGALEQDRELAGSISEEPASALEPSRSGCRSGMGGVPQF